VSDPRLRRLSALSDGLTASHLDGLLITSLPNIRYLTGFSGSSALLFVSGRDVLLITDFRYQTQVAGEVGDFARVSIEPQSLWTGMATAVALPSLEVIGFESGHILHRDFQRLLEAGARWQWRPTTDVVEVLPSAGGCRRAGAHSRRQWYRDASARTNVAAIARRPDGARGCRNPREGIARRGQ
jgi:Xaa-Pro aminopeptidase